MDVDGPAVGSGDGTSAVVGVRQTRSERAVPWPSVTLPPRLGSTRKWSSLYVMHLAVVTAISAARRLTRG